MQIRMPTGCAYGQQRKPRPTLTARESFSLSDIREADRQPKNPGEWITTRFWSVESRRTTRLRCCRCIGASPMSELEQVLIEVWRQALVDSANYVQIGQE